MMHARFSHLRCQTNMLAAPVHRWTNPADCQCVVILQPEYVLVDTANAPVPGAAAGATTSTHADKPRAGAEGGGSADEQ